MTHIFKDLKASLNFLDIVFQDVQAIWLKRGGPANIIEILNNKKKEISEDKLKGVMIFDHDLPVGFAWVELMNPKYGNMVMHTLAEVFQEPLADYMASSGMMDGAVLELIQFVTNTIYFDTFRRLGLYENKRQRMAKYLNEPIEKPEPRPDTELVLQTETHIPISSAISYRAHQVSRDYEQYCDLTDPEKRLGLEEAVFNGKYGPVIRPASVMLYYLDKPVGACTVVEITCWGYPKVPWVFDVTVEPEFIGKGYGEYLMLNSMYELIQLQYPIMGLAVTVTNTRAIKLYERLGFFVVEYFSEFTRLV